ncbi:aminoacyl-tRNA deacylase [Lacisediminihabitans profunda]|uniref:YbaK/EbsC family protein n=1 Tax=Lacisediminihabitans profunda TaxID=2594790 RepID=A0A5C8UYN9_9MICO|nr:YbaK/EbsC family protein [Lacisediminihabitans profunda]TXN32876.1 YbaK/EbsC family protein [Lacisediminihabitans profunda]
MTDPVGRARVLADAEARGLDVEFVERPAAGSLEEAAALLGIDPRGIVKTLVVRRHTPSDAPNEYLFALIPGDRQISWSKLRAIVGVNKLSLPTAELALEATGYERGTITPLGSSSAWPVYVDAVIAGARVALGAGEPGFSAFLDADALIAAFDATVADISA